MSAPRYIVEAITRDAARRRDRDEYKGHISYRFCGLCGTIDWSASSKEGDGESAYATPPSECGRCQWVSQRHPELAQWVADVARFAVELAASQETP